MHPTHAAFKVLTLLAAFVVGTSSGYAGHAVNNGTDLDGPSQGSAWFLGNDAVSYCVIVAADFGVDGNEIVSDVRTAIDSWEAYIDRKTDPTASPNPRSIVGGKGLPRQFVQQSTCDHVDLRLIFGATDALVTSTLATSGLNNPIAFASRTSYDAARGWGQGFLWFARQGAADPTKGYPNWAKPSALYGVILHELGHVLGCGHVTGTVMDPDLADVVLRTDHPDIDTALLKRIDQRAELFTCDTCSSIYAGHIAEITPSPQDAATFQLFTGRAPVGVVREQLQIGFSDGSTEKVLTLGDSLGQVQLPLKHGAYYVDQRLAFFGEPVFKAALLNPRTGAVDSDGFTALGNVSFGEIKSAAGESMMFILSHNVELTGMLRLTYVRGGVEQNLFMVNAPWLP